MDDEVYDIFDEQGAHIGTATWTEVHTKGLIHKTSAVLLFKDKTRKEVLIQKRSMKMDHDPGLWTSSAGGHILEGRSPEEGARSEIQEELFAEHQMPDVHLEFAFMFFLDEDIPNNREFIHIYRAYSAGPFFHDKKKEVAEIKWVDWKDLLKELDEHPEKFTNSFRMIIKEYQKTT